jgi:uncharacterized protein YutE (UPF0331/DUF86 family)|tara:strand:+ start:299 stop:472 length:174 start_codon:yes stop_codon:yes gene_type:complete
MTKAKVPKIFNVVKKTVDEKDQLVIRYRHVDKKQIKELKKELNLFVQAWLQKIVSEE